jgi:two-component system sensor histidine kinase GlrK
MMRGMRVPRLNSLRGLIILGTLLVATPLCVVLGHAMLQMRALSHKSTRLIETTAKATEADNKLVSAARSLERVAQLRLEIGDTTLDDDFAKPASQTLESLQTLDTVAGESIGEDTKTVRHKVEAIRAAIQDASSRNAKAGDPALKDSITENIKELSSAINRINQTITLRTTASLEELQTSTAQTEGKLLKALYILLPATIGIVIIFLLTISRPLRRIDSAIDTLGRGRYDAAIVIRGPTDLVRLGEQLEWLRQRLIEVAEAKNRFLRHMSHELKTPLASIREGTELLLEGAVGTIATEQREVIGILRDNGIQLQRHIENLLSYSAWEARTVGLEPEEFPLRELIRSVIDAHRMTLLSHRLRLTAEVSDIIVTADRNKLRLILDNLFSNAVKYTPHDGSISVRAKSEGAELVVDVIDSGPGIAPQDRDRLFEAFYTGSSKAMGPLSGTGIGLSVVLEFTEAHGGSINLIDRQGTGAHFRLRLPTNSRNARTTQSAHVA